MFFGKFITIKYKRFSLKPKNSLHDCRAKEGVSIRKKNTSGNFCSDYSFGENLSLNVFQRNGQGLSRLKPKSLETGAN